MKTRKPKVYHLIYKTIDQKTCSFDTRKDTIFCAIYKEIEFI